MTTALYPGSFDPITFGHLDVIGRAAAVFDKLVVGVLVNPKKSPLLDLDERIATIREAIDEELPSVADRIDVAGFDGLTVDFARRSVPGSSFVACARSAISSPSCRWPTPIASSRPDVDTIFFMTALEHAYLSSSLVKEIASFGGDVSKMIPAAAVRRLRR